MDRTGDDGGDGQDERYIEVGQEEDGRPVWLPVERVLTGRAFLTGKSGSGKSNTASVVVEELLERAYPVLIVDTDGEYYGLKEEYELLHAGADEECDIQVDVEHAEKLAELALEENVPIILDVSGYLDEEVSNGLIRETARHLFAKEKKLKKPFLLVVEEVHEYIPERGGMDETGKMLIKVGKRGRKHGLGIVGISQRPADVKKDFITQANWLVWHRLTWDNDTKVVRRIVGDEYGATVSQLNPGEAFVQLDWDDRDVRRVQFKRKRTFDAGATPGLDDFERPELKSVDDALMENLSTITERQEREQDRIESLEARLEKKDDRIEDLEGKLERARDVSSAAQQVADAVAGEAPDTVQTRLGAKNAEIDRLHDRVAELEDRLEGLAGALPPELSDPDAEGEREAVDLAAFLGNGTENGDGAGSAGANGDGSTGPGDAGDRPDDGTDAGPPEDFLDDYRGIGPYLESARAGNGDGNREKGAGRENGKRTENGTAGDAADESDGDTGTDDGAAVERRDREADDRPDAVPESDDAEWIVAPSPGDGGSGPGDDGGTGPGPVGGGPGPGASEGDGTRNGSTLDPVDPDRVADLLRSTPVAVKLRAAVREARCNESAAMTVVSALIDDGPVTVPEAAEVAGASQEGAYSLLSALRARDLAVRDEDHRYALDPAGMERVVEEADDSPHLGELQAQWEV